MTAATQARLSNPIFASALAALLLTTAGIVGCGDPIEPDELLDVSGRFGLMTINGAELPFAFETPHGTCYEVQSGTLTMLNNSYTLRLVGLMAFDCENFYEDDFAYSAGQYQVHGDSLIFAPSQSPQFPGRVVEDTVFVNPSFVPASIYYVFKEYGFVEEP